MQLYNTRMEFPHPVPQDLAEMIARRFRVLGEPMRIRLLDALRDGPATVGTLTTTLEATQQNVSKHLAVLHQAGIVSRTKRGTFVDYAIADPAVFALCDHVCGDLRRQATHLDRLLATEGATA